MLIYFYRDYTEPSEDQLNNFDELVINNTLCIYQKYVDLLWTTQLEDLWIEVEHHGLALNFTEDLFISFQDLELILSIVNRKWFQLQAEYSDKESDQYHRTLLRQKMESYRDNPLLDLLLTACNFKVSVISYSD